MKKGFTLIELLAVIVILAVLALIVTPVITDIITNARKSSYKISTAAIKDAALLHYHSELVTNNIGTSYFNCEGNTCSNTQSSFTFNGLGPDEGMIKVNNKGKVSGYTVYNNNYYSIVNNKVVEGYVPDSIMYSWNYELLGSVYSATTYPKLEELNVSTIYNDCLAFKNDDVINAVYDTIKKGYTLYDLTGTKEWYNDPSALKSRIDTIANYNSNHSDATVTGVVFDIEFYLNSAWSTDPTGVLTTMINTYKEAIDYAHSKGLEVVICLPYWLDDYSTYLDEFIKISDGVSIMNYNMNILVEGVSPEVDIARKYDKQISSISDTDSYSSLGLDRMNSDWLKITQKYKYNKLEYAYHYLTPLLEMTNDLTNYKVILKDASGNILYEQETYISIEGRDGRITKNTGDYGFFNILLPDGNYTFDSIDFNISNVNIDGTTINVTVGDRK